MEWKDILNEQEIEVVQEQFDNDIKGKEDNSDNKEELYLTQIKGHEHAISQVLEELELFKLTLELYKENPTPANIQFEYEKDPRYIEKVVPLNIKKIEAKITGLEKPIGSSLYQIDLLKAKLSELEGD